LARDRVVKVIGMAKELDALADLDHKHIVIIVVDRSGPANRNHAVDRRLAHVGTIVADEQLVFIEGIKPDPVRIAKPQATNCIVEAGSAALTPSPRAVLAQQVLRSVRRTRWHWAVAARTR
jgi:hypothetical protein